LFEYGLNLYSLYVPQGCNECDEDGAPAACGIDGAFCDDCYEQFAVNGGCEAEDPVPYIPQGCDECDDDGARATCDRFVTLEKAKDSTGKPNGKKAIDGKLDTSGSVKKSDDPWISARAPKGKNVRKVIVYNVAKEKHQKRLDGFEVWVGKKFGKRGTRCGYPFSDVKSVGPFTAVCGGKSNERYVTVYLPGKNKKLKVAEIYVLE